jgi:hypothetical protein
MVGGGAGRFSSGLFLHSSVLTFCYLQVVLFKFGKKETTGEIPCLEIPIIYEVE